MRQEQRRGAMAGRGPGGWGGHGAVCIAGVTALLAGLATDARGEPLRISAFPDTLRFDLESERFLEAGRADAPQDPSPYELRLSPLRLTAARGEVVAFQLALTGRAGPQRVFAEAAVDEDGAPSPLRVELFEARPVHVESPSVSPRVFSLGPGTYPDPLVPTSTVTVPFARGLAVLWVDVFVPEDARVGTHSTAVLVGEERVRVEVEVLDVTLPAADVAGLGAVNFGSILERARRDPALELRWMQVAHAHHLTVELMRITPPLGADGAIDWDAWASRVGPYVDGSAFTAASGYAGPRAGQPVTRFMIPLTDWWPDPATDAGLPSNPQRWSKTLRAWEETVKGRGWWALPNATRWVMFINSLDEPKSEAALQSLARYQRLIEAAKLEDRKHVLFRVDGNFGQPIEGWSDEQMAELLGPATDLWNAHGAPETLPWDLLIHRREKKGEGLMVYASNTGGEPAIPPLVIDASLVGARAWGWMVYRYGLVGALNWEVDGAAGCVENPKCSPGGTMNLDATLIYRGEEVGAAPDQPIPSIRLKALRRGAQDAALLSMLAKKDPAAAAELAERMIPRALGDQVPKIGGGTWSLDPGAYQRAREAILDRLLGRPRALPLSAVRVDQGPAWLRYRSFWYVGAGVLAAVLAAIARALWRRRYREAG